MRLAPRPDDYATRREHLKELSDAELRARFWHLADAIVAPMLELARTHTSPSIERSVLLRMGFGSAEAQALVAALGERGLLGRGAGRLVLELALRRGVPVRAAGLALLEGQGWEELSG